MHRGAQVPAAAADGGAVYYAGLINLWVPLLNHVKLILEFLEAAGLVRHRLLRRQHVFELFKLCEI